MANSFTLKSGAYGGRYLQLSCTQTKEIANNRSKINWTLSSIGGSSSYYSTGATTVYINGVQVYYKERVNWDAKVFPAAKGSVSGVTYVDHDSKGKKQIAVSMTTAIYVGSSSATTYSNTWTLDDIPRQATITSAPNFTDLDNPTIYISNPANATMDVWLEPNPVGDHLCVRKSIPNTGSYTWTLTDSERNELRNHCTTNQCTVRIGLYSYIGGTTFTDYKDKLLTIQETDGTKPSVSMNIDLNNSSLPSAFKDMCIQGKSRLKISLSAQGKYGAGIKSFSAFANLSGYFSSLAAPFPTNTSASFDTDVLTQSGNITIEGSAKDTREFTGTDNQEISVLAYSKPLVIPIGNENAILCYRGDGNGKRVGGSTSVFVKAKRSYYNLSGKNTCALQWRRRAITEAWSDSTHKWHTLIANTNTSTDEYNALLVDNEGDDDDVFELNKSYAIQIRAIDDIGEYDIKNFEIPTQDVALHLGKGGKNVSVGTYCDYSVPYRFFSEWIGLFDKGLWGTSLNYNVTDVLTFAEGSAEGLTPIIINDSTNRETLPAGDYAYSVGIVHKRKEGQCNVYLTDYISGKIAINVLLDNTWTGWKYITPQ